MVRRNLIIVVSGLWALAVFFTMAYLVAAFLLRFGAPDIVATFRMGILFVGISIFWGIPASVAVAVILACTATPRVTVPPRQRGLNTTPNFFS